MARQEIEKAFDERKIRSVWDDEAEKWYFSVVDVIAVLDSFRGHKQSRSLATTGRKWAGFVM